MRERGKGGTEREKGVHTLLSRIFVLEIVYQF